MSHPSVHCLSGVSRRVRVLPLFHWACLILALAILSAHISGGVVAQEEPGKLSEAESTAMSAITVKRVKSTIAFLASDEMKGRDTPSQELDIASAYVAARFRGAGLTPVTGSSFYQTTKVATTTLPTTGTVTHQGQSLEVMGVLGASRDEVDWIGSVFNVTDQTPRDQKFDSAVTLVAPKFEGRRAAASFRFKLNRLQQNGAMAILVQVEPGHPLIAQASQASRPRLIQVRGALTVPVLLIPKQGLPGETSIQLAKQKFGEAVVKNVVGMLKGSDETLAKEAIIFSAHLDHIGQVSGVGDTINNGADDDATGVTAVLSLADAFAALPTAPKRTVIFMTFWGEEKGLLGSRHYVKEPLWPLEKTVANINLEMLGRPEAGAAEKTWMTGWDQSDLGALMAQGAQRVGVRVFEHPRFSAMLYRASDNYSFVEKGVIAHSFSAGSLHDDYHQPTDEWEKLELKHMTRVIEGLFAGTLPIAEGTLTPKASPTRRKQ